MYQPTDKELKELNMTRKEYTSWMRALAKAQQESEGDEGDEYGE